MIVIVDYKMGNVGSIFNMLKRIGVEAVISDHASEIQAADKLVLPGVGSFDAGIESLKTLGLTEILTEQVLERKVPILGICLGMQLMTLHSQEGQLNGLGWIDAETIRFSFQEDNRRPKIPHMGWNSITLSRSTPIFPELGEEQRFYFVHSYHVVCDREHALSTTSYGYEFVSSFLKENVLGVQFHPEKSHQYGMRFFKNWCEHNQ